MQEPIRTLRVQADANGVRPSNPQYAGVQGEHNATRVIFALDEALLRAEYRYRFEFVDSMGGLDAGGEATPVDGELSCLLPEERAEDFSARILDVSAGTIEVLTAGESMQAVPFRQPL